MNKLALILGVVVGGFFLGYGGQRMWPPVIDMDDASSVILLSDYGYTDIDIKGPVPCADKAQGSRFVARNPQGILVDGKVCCNSQVCGPVE